MRWPERIGRYEVKGLLGTGGTAEVLHGVVGEVDVALKCVLREHASDSVATSVLLDEGALLARIDHPNVVSLIEIVHGPPPALALERLLGRTLAEVLARSPKALGASGGNSAEAGLSGFNADLAIEIGAQAAAALAAVHAATDERGAALDVVHRDVSPDNLFITTAGIVKLFDFNVAFTRDRKQAPAPGSLQGRVAYMAPEQARGEAVDARADVFSLGAVLWELLVGERLFWRGNTLATLRALLDDPVPLASSRAKNVSSALDQLIAETLSPTVSARPSALALEQRLRERLDDDPRRGARLGALAAC